MKKRKTRLRHSRKAVSSVISTVILVAVGITVAVAVAYWMGGIAGQYPKFEKVEIQSATCATVTTAPEGWSITMTLKNSDTATSTLIGVFLNDVEVSAYGASGITVNTTTTSMSATETLESGQTATITIYIDDNYPTSAPLTSGTTVNVKLHGAGGMDYKKLIELV